jgi:hypothetical protein
MLMNRRKKDIMILSILVPILVLVIALPTRKMGRISADHEVKQESSASPRGERADPGEPERAQREKIRAQQIAAENRYLEQGIPRDPFAEPGRQQTIEKVLVVRLNGFLASDNSRAIINGEIVSEGAVIHGLTVKAILPEEVILERKGREHSLTIDKPIKIRTTTH